MKKNKGIMVLLFFTLLASLSLSCQLDNNKYDYIEIKQLTNQQKTDLFNKVYNDIGKYYDKDVAHFVYEYLTDIIGNEKPSFEDEISINNIYAKSLPYRSGVIDYYYEHGDIVFYEDRYTKYSFLGFIRSYNINPGQIEYISIKNNRIQLLSSMVNIHYVHIVALALEKL